jgi:multisubunit Na+/H+ antiporter MnhG subunit
MLALSVVVVLLWVVAPVVLYQIGRFAHGLTQPKARRTAKRANFADVAVPAAQVTEAQ